MLKKFLYVDSLVFVSYQTWVIAKLAKLTSRITRVSTRSGQKSFNWQADWHRILQFLNPIDINVGLGVSALPMIPLRKVVACRC